MVHKCAAHLILGRNKYDHVTPALVEATLAASERTNSLLNMTVRLQMPQPFSSSIPADLVIPYKKKRSLRSENKNLTEKYQSEQSRLSGLST